MRHGAEWLVVLLSVRLLEVQTPGYSCHGGTHDTTRHTTGPVSE